MSASIRISILLLYLRVFGKGEPRRAIILYVLLALQALYVIVFSILPGFVCTPIDNVKYALEHSRYCNDPFYISVQTGLFSSSMAFDVILLIFPIFYVFKLQLPMKKRIGLLCIFALGTGSVKPPVSLT